MSERLKGTKDKRQCQETRRQSSKSGTPRLLLNDIGYSKYLKMSSGSHIEIWLQIFIFWLQPLSWLEWDRCRLWLKGFPWSPQELISSVLVVTKNCAKRDFRSIGCPSSHVALQFSTTFGDTVYLLPYFWRSRLIWNSLILILFKSWSTFAIRIFVFKNQ